MWNRVEQYVEKYKLLNANDLYLVALSGGADSVALLIMLDEMGYKVHAVHCNFHLRGDESDGDERFCEQLCRARNIPFHRVHFDTHEYAQLHHVSIELAARELRYSYFEQLRRDLGAEAVCVAHHRDDQVETVLMNLVRGAGVRGLSGMRPRQGHIVRPLLCVTRAEIETFLRERGQQWVVDSTNLNDDATRNRVRHHLVPLLTQLNAQASANIARSADRMADATALLDEQLAPLRGCRRLTVDELHKRAWSSYLMYEVMRKWGFNAAQSRQIYEAVRSGATGRLFSSADYDLLVDRREVLIEEHLEPLKPLVIPEEGCYVMADGRRVKVEQGEVWVSRQPLVATLDADSVHFPLTVRRVVRGDRMQPYGMTGSKLLSDLMTDSRMSLFEKRRQLVVTDASGRVIWLIGLRTSQLAAVTDQTRRVVTIKFSPNYLPF